MRSAWFAPSRGGGSAAPSCLRTLHRWLTDAIKMSKIGIGSGLAGPERILEEDHCKPVSDGGDSDNSRHKPANFRHPPSWSLADHYGGQATRDTAKNDDVTTGRPDHRQDTKLEETSSTTDPAQGRDGWRACNPRQQLLFFTRGPGERGEGAI
jgi:hypothetical protein